MILKKFVTTVSKVDIVIKEATLLSIEEAENLLTGKERKYKNGWWLRSPGFCNGLAASVYDDGSFNYCGHGVSSDNGCVRPALIFESSSLNVGDTFEFAGNQFKVISNSLAWMYNDDLGCHAFNEDREAVNANVYEYSDIKKFIDDLFEKAMKKYGGKQ